MFARARSLCLSRARPRLPARPIIDGNSDKKMFDMAAMSWGIKDNGDISVRIPRGESRGSVALESETRVHCKYSHK